MKVAIRDDDTAYFTQVNELVSAYSFMNKGGCVSLSIVPYAYPIHRDDVFPYGDNIKSGYYAIDANDQLVSHIKEGIRDGKYEVLLHGYSHEYCKKHNKWISEMKWKPKEQLIRELTKGKQYLEGLFEQNINVFVAPNNSIGIKGIDVIEELNMEYSGIIQKNDRRITVKYIINFFKRWLYRGFYKIPYPGILDYGQHKELVAFTLDNYERLVYEYKMCKKRNQPFVIYTHYWQINEDKKIKKLLEDLYNYVIEDGAEIVALSECFKE